MSISEEEISKYINLQQQYDAAQKLAGIGSWTLNLLDNTQVWSDGVYRILGEKEQSFEPSFEIFMSFLSESEQVKVQNSIQDAISGTKEYDIFHNINRKDGSICNVHAKAKVIYNEDNMPIKLFGTVHDITLQTQLQEKTKNTLSTLNSVIDNVNNLIFYKDINYVYMGCNHAFEKFMGHTREELIGNTDFDFFPEDVAKHFRNLDQKIFDDNTSVINAQWVVYPDGSDVYLHTTTTPFYDDNGTVIGLVGNSVDLTKEKDLSDKLSYHAHHDALTNLPNRVLFNDRLDHAIENAKRKQNELAVLFLDLDHFKQINDSLGHDVGDEILKIVSKRINSVLRSSDTLARLGGDEFTILIENINQIQESSLISQKILEVLNHPIHIEEHTLYISTSIGISLYPKDATNIKDLLKHADSAMYKAKDEGRNNFQYYSSEMTELVLDKLVIGASLRESLHNKDFIVYYQPQIDATNNKLIGMEALVRWQEPTKGLISPAEFIPLAETTGLIIAIDRFVMRTAITQIVAWYAQGLTPGILAINLSVKQLQEKDFIIFLQETIKERGCKPEWIELEITESQIITNPEQAIKVLTQISDLGIGLAIDDFGTGYSSLAYLKKLPIDKLKIDQSFVRDLPDDDEDSTITKTIIGLAKNFNLKVIAEGVETQEQKDFLLKNGCENIQGYYYSKPLPAAELEHFLKNNY